ncbi:MAG TPA: hypothetical protein VFL87_00160 [Thermoleophilaceae bacterium]|nr:hypothetical protein [Thermoleophilaceae bacterium]
MLPGLLLGDAPDLPSLDLSTNPKPYLILAAIGFALALIGHMSRTKTLIAAGLGLIFLASFALPLYLHLTT